MTLLASMQSSFNEHSKNIAVSFEGKEYSYETLSKFVSFRIGEIERCLIKPNEVICIESTNSLEYWISCLSALFLGLRITPFKSNDGLPQELWSRRHVGLDGNSEIKVTPYKEMDIERYRDDIVFCKSGNVDSSVIFFTSGTTGTKKSISLSNQNMISRIQTTQKFFPKNSVSFTFMPPFSTLGFHFQLRQWLKGGLLILDTDFDNIINALFKYSVDYIVGSPHQFRSFIDDLSINQIKNEFSVHQISVGGGELTKLLKMKLVEVFNSDIYCLFGASETGLWSIHNVTDDDDYSNLGNFSLGCQCEIDLLDGESGNLRIKNSHMANGYLNAASDEFKNGWFYSGDRAFTRDNQIYLLGRDDAVVNVGGIKISPQQIDDFVLSLDGVKDASCFWIKDKLGYNELWCAVVLNKKVALENLLQNISFRFGVESGPKRIIPVEFIPRTYSGKPQRNLMSEKITSKLI
jgi:acyl-CoA synthetase (AMP-forming)/AMP-acid ligase II